MTLEPIRVPERSAVRTLPDKVRRATARYLCRELVDHRLGDRDRPTFIGLRRHELQLAVGLRRRLHVDPPAHQVEIAVLRATSSPARIPVTATNRTNRPYSGYPSRRRSSRRYRTGGAMTSAASA